MTRVQVRNPMSESEASEAHSTFPHVRPRERGTLISEAVGDLPYYPKLGRDGQPLRCHKDGCNEYARSNARKQLCPKHYLDFLNRSNRDLAKPKCVGCGTRTVKEFRGHPTCDRCAARVLDKENEAAARQRERLEKADTLREASTLEELKDWIERYVL